jgi:Mg2+ and Co2+ transporter CorA
VAEFKYLGLIVVNQSYIYEEAESRLNSRNACYIQFQILVFCPLSKNIKIKMYTFVTLPVTFIVFETWTLILREEHRLMVFQNRDLRILFGPKREKAMGDWR